MSKQRKLEREKKRAASKREALLLRIAGIVILVAFIGLVGYGIGSAVYRNMKSVKPSNAYSAELDDNGFIKNVTAKDLVTLPEYKNYTAPLSEIEYPDSSVDEDIENVLSSHQVLNEETDAKIKDGDKVSIEYVGTVDGVAFEGGSTNGTPTDLTIGSGSYIDDFEQQLIGHGIGETVTVEVTFPDDYGNEELNGKDAVFTVDIDGIYEKPEFTDAFVEENLSEYASTVEEYRQYLKDSHYDDNLKDWVEDYLVDNSTVSSYPKAYLKNLKSTQKYTDQEQFESMNQMYMQYYGSTMYESFEDYVGQTEAEYDASLQETCEEQAKAELVYQAILENEGVTVSEADYRAYLTEKDGSDDSFNSMVEEHGLGYTMKDMVKNKAVEIALKGVTVK
ncbi:MAG: FKBP-type peptidyl-prolyl cis-trans isomerase [Lachnospiraceae bacterium]|nr:FKBP-type peptidyl-prolyl cis-trans isomerase [Lachnospiraceae bacterium]